jgi:cell division protein FtsB
MLVKDVLSTGGHGEVGRAAAKRDEQNKSTRSVMVRIVFLSLLIVLAATVFVLYLQQQSELERLAKKKELLEAERDKLARVNADLTHLDAISGTPAYWERLARDQLGMVRPDDLVIIVD